MATIKFVHILKRVEIIDRDIAELKEIGTNLLKKRNYHDAIKIATEKEINNLLNERVKLMDLGIENPPKNIMDLLKDPETERPFSKIPFQEFEESYLNHSKNKEIDISSSEPTVTKSKLQFESSKLNSSDSKETPLISSDLKPRSRAELLKDLPPLEY